MGTTTRRQDPFGDETVSGFCPLSVPSPQPRCPEQRLLPREACSLGNEGSQGDLVFTDPTNAPIWKAVPESKAPLACAGSPAPCIRPPAARSPTQRSGEPVSAKRQERQSEAPGSRRRPKNPFCSGNQVSPESGKGRKKKRALGRGGQERNRRPESSARCLCVCVLICDGAAFCLQVP